MISLKVCIGSLFVLLVLKVEQTADVEASIHYLSHPNIETTAHNHDKDNSKPQKLTIYLKQPTAGFCFNFRNADKMYT